MAGFVPYKVFINLHVILFCMHLYIFKMILNSDYNVLLGILALHYLGSMHSLLQYVFDVFHGQYISLLLLPNTLIYITWG